MNEEKIKLEEVCRNKCYCDLEYPWKKCAPCTAARTLNESAEIIRNGYKTVMEQITAGNKLKKG